MTRQAIADMIASVGIPYAYNEFDVNDEGRPDGPPFICFLYPAGSGFAADDCAYVSFAQLVVELYTDNVDFTLEAALEAALRGADLVCDKEQAYIDAEHMYQTTYTTEVILTDE